MSLLNSVTTSKAEETSDVVSYDQFFRLATDGFRRYGYIFDLPVSEDPYGYLAKVYRRDYPEGCILDFGCGAETVLRKVLQCDDGNYYGCDSDPAAPVQFRSLTEIPQGLFFQIIFANQVLEHFPFAEITGLVMHLGKLLAPGGILLLSVPNPQHPTRHLSNPTHLTPLNYLNLYALMTLAGLETIHCARCNKVAGPRWFERPLINIMCRVFRMDWCDTVYAVGLRQS